MTKKEPFEKVDFLGAGGFAQTWLVRVIDEELLEEWGKELVAIKIPLTKQKEKALKHELLIAGTLHSQLSEMETRNIVKYLGFEIFDGNFVMVMEYISGGSLRKVIGNPGRWKRIEVKKALAIAEGILHGLSVIHEKHVVHRDIKPENILMDGDVPKIGDLGIGKILRTNELASTSVGTLYYQSPESLFEECGASFNTDIWSFGVTLYEMLCGQFPFGITPNMPEGKVIDLIKDENVKLTFPEDVEIPSQIQAIISKTLKKNPKHRYQTAGEVLKDMKKSIKDEDESVEKEICMIQQILIDPTKVSLAEEKLTEILKRFPDSPRIYLRLGEFYNKCENYDKAIDIFKKGMEKNPDFSLFYWGIAIAYHKKGNLKSAAEALEKALSLGLEGSLARYAKVLLETIRRKI